MYKFKIKIGDWSGDGHGQYEDFMVLSNKPINEVREAFLAAQELFPQLCPTKYCCNFEEANLPEGMLKKLINAGWKATTHSRVMSPFDMASILIWFLTLGDSELVVKLENDNTDVLSYYGQDNKGRHISFIGYGCFQ